MPVRIKNCEDPNKENRVSNKSSVASESLSPTRDLGYHFDHDKDVNKQQAWAERYEQGLGCETAYFLDTGLSEFKEQAIRVVAQSRVDATGSIENDGRIATIDKCLQGPAVQKFRESIRQQFQELERQNFVRKLGDGRGQVNSG